MLESILYVKEFVSGNLYLNVSYSHSNEWSQVLGTPTREEIKCMNPNYTEFKFPQIKAHPWHKVPFYTTVCLT